jgi:hypothetical protein
VRRRDPACPRGAGGTGGAGISGPGGMGGMGGTGGVGVDVVTGSLTNDGTIAGGGYGGGGIGGGGSNPGASGLSGFGGIGVSFQSGGTLTNAGLIRGGFGRSGIVDAVYFGAGASSLILDPGASFEGAVVADAAFSNVLELASGASAGTISGLGTGFVNFAATTIDANAVWTLTGGNTIASGATLTELSGATLTASGTLVNNGGIVLDPSTMVVGNLVGTGSVTIQAGSTLEVQGSIAATETIVFAGPNAYLHLDSPDNALGSIANFGFTDTIDLKGVDPTSVVLAGGALTFGTGSFPLSIGAGDALQSVASADGALLAVEVPCFLNGTLILTDRGEVPVETLAVGDCVVTLSGEVKPIVWIGLGDRLVARGVRCAATPIKICRGAIADNVPHHDLRVTKGHSLYLEKVLIPVEFLINHRTILWDDWAQAVTVYHIELETHDVLLANGASAESYRDDGNRWLFQNTNSGWDLSSKPPYAPVLTGGPIVDAVWKRLLDRAGSRPGMPLTDDPDLHLLVDGTRLDAAVQSGDFYIFNLCHAPTEVRVVSRAASPQELGLGRDPRSLGVAVRRMVVRQKTLAQNFDADDKRLVEGFHVFEADPNIRWTDGDAVVPESLFDGFIGPLNLTLRLGGKTSYVDAGAAQQAA